MDTNTVVNKVVNIVKEYRLGKKSMYALLQESGYFEVHDQVDENMIIKALEKQPESVNEWISWSEDQRVSAGWYLKIEDGKNIVANFSTKGGYKETVTEYPDKMTACAAFIKNEIEYIRK